MPGKIENHLYMDIRKASDIGPHKEGCEGLTEIHTYCYIYSYSICAIGVALVEEDAPQPIMNI